MRKTIVGITSALAMMALGANAAKAECGQISISEMNWASAAVVTAVSKFLLEQGYGCKVKTVPSSTVPVVTSLAENGTPDIATELWLNGAASLPKLIEDGKVVELTKVLSDGGVEGWYVPDYLVEKHPELATIEGVLKNPDLVGGRFHQCPEGWGCQIANASLAKAFELESNGIKVFQHGSGETLATSIASAYAEKAPWFGYYWAPTSVLGKYPMVRVDLGPVDEKIHACNADKDCHEVGKSQYPASPVATVVTTAFTQKAPDAAELMKNVSFTNKQMGEVLAWKEDNRASADEAAVYFIQNYKDVWSKWLNDDARKKLSSLLK
jgi:glycine betaine/proline transport system substrate-binding protein